MAIVTDPTTGAVYDDGQPDPNAGTWVTDAAGVPTYTPPPDVQAMIDQIMSVPQANPNATQAPMPDPRGLPPPVVDPRDVSGGVNPAGPVDHAPLPPVIIGNDYRGKGGTKRLAADKAAIAATAQPGGEPQVDPATGALASDRATRLAVVRPAKLDGAIAEASQPGGEPQVDPTTGALVAPPGATTGALVAPPGAISASYGSKQYSPEVEAAINESPMVRAAFEGFATAEQRAAADAEAQLASGAAMADAARDTENRRFDAEAAELLAQQTAIENYARDMEQARAKTERRLAERRAIADQAKQKYLADAAVAGAMVSDPYANLRGAGGGMAMLAMAGSAWLANMGPGSPVMPDIAGMIENVVQNTRATQDSNRANAWKTVELDNDLLNLARQDVEDEEIAYSRYSGFLTVAYHTQVAVTAAKFAGQKAAAAHQGALDAIAASNQEYADGVRQTTWNKMAAIDKERNDLIAKILDNASAERRASIGAYANNLNAKANLARATATTTGVPVLNPDGTRSKYVVSFDEFGDNVPASTRTDILKKAELAPKLYKAADDVAKAYKALDGGFAGKWGTLTASDTRAVAYQSALAAYKNVLKQWGDTGANLTTNEVENARAAAGAIDDNISAIVDKLKSTVGMDTPDYVRTIAQGALAITSQVKAGLKPYLREETAADSAALDARGVGKGSPFAGADAAMQALASAPSAGAPEGVPVVSANARGTVGSGRTSQTAFAPTAAEVDSQTWDAVNAAMSASAGWQGTLEGRAKKSRGFSPLESRLLSAWDTDRYDSYGISRKTPPAYFANLYALYLRSGVDDSVGRDAAAELAATAAIPSTFESPSPEAAPEAVEAAKVLLALPRPPMSLIRKYLKGELANLPAETVLPQGPTAPSGGRAEVLDYLRTGK